MNILMLEKCLEMGGVSTFIKTLSDGWLEKGHSVYLVTANNGTNKKEIEKFKKKGIFVLTVPYSTRRPLLLYKFLKATLKLVKHTKIDVIHSQHRLTHFAALIAGKLKNIPRLLTFHAFKKDHKLLTKMWKSEHITVPSLALKKRYIDYYGLREEQIEVIPNSIKNNYEVNEKLVSLFKKNIFSNSDLFYITYVGRLSQEKGVDTLLRSIPLVTKNNQNIAFRIFGDGPELENLKELCVDLAIDPELILRGANSNINELLSLTDLSVIPSRSETFSLTALENMRAGNPIIATNVGGIPEVIGNRKTALLIEPDNENVLAENILKLYRDEKLRSRLAEEGRKRFLDEFSVDDFHAAYMQEYEQAISAYRA